jgi:GST-like protein
MTWWVIPMTQPEEIPMLEVWSWPTPNGHKVHIALEELGLEYKVIPVNIGAGDQFKPEFLKITPNHRIPAIVDPDGPGGKPFTLFESAAIMIYLSEKTGGKLIPKDPIGRYKCLEWMMFQMGGVGPMFGQWNHFGAYAPEKIPYAVERYANEVKRLTRVMNHRLEAARWLAGDEYSMADIITFPWIRTATEASSRFAERGYIDLGDYPAVKRWLDEIEARPAVQRGLKVLADAREQKAISDAEREVYFGKTQFQAR